MRLEGEGNLGHRILVVDDEPAILLTMKAILEMSHYEVETAASAADAAGRLKGSVYDLVITDLNMETEKSGFEVARLASKQPYRPAVAILTAYPDLGADWKTQGADSLLIKPTNIAELLERVKVLIAARRNEPATENDLGTLTHFPEQSLHPDPAGRATRP
jgi:DNA-binding response OmpR family regulator